MVPKKLGLKILIQQKFWVQHNLTQQIKVNKLLVKKNFGRKKICWTILIKAAKKIGSHSLVKIGLQTAEILLIRTNVAMTFVALINVSKVKRGGSYFSSRGLFGSIFFVFGPIELIF